MNEIRKRASAEPPGFGLVSFFLVLLGAAVSPRLNLPSLSLEQIPLTRLSAGSAFLVILVILSGSYLGFPFALSGCFFLGVRTRIIAETIREQSLLGDGLSWPVLLRMFLLFPLAFLLLVRAAQLSFGICVTVLGGRIGQGRPTANDFYLLITAILFFTLLFSPIV